MPRTNTKLSPNKAAANTPVPITLPGQLDRRWRITGLWASYNAAGTGSVVITCNAVTVFELDFATILTGLILPDGGLLMPTAGGDGGGAASTGTVVVTLSALTGAIGKLNVAASLE